MSIRYTIKMSKSSLSAGKYYARPAIDETVDLEGLAGHMAKHNTVFSAGVIKGLLTDAVTCIKELVLDGKSVKLDNLAIFSAGIKNKKGGADSEDDFSVAKNVSGIRLRARATGSLASSVLANEYSLKKFEGTSTSDSSTSGGGSTSGSGSSSGSGSDSGSGSGSGSGSDSGSSSSDTGSGTFQG